MSETQTDELPDTETLRALVEVEETVRWWGSEYQITPRLVHAVFGDGKKLVGIAPLNTRPNYYVVRVDSSCDLSDYGDFVDDNLDEVLEAIDYQFSNLDREEEYLREDGASEEEIQSDQHAARLAFPVLDDSSGVAWFELDWPKR